MSTSTSTPATPQWIHVGQPVEPNSWVFFVVAQIAGRYRPVAIVSSICAEDETLQGYPLVAACHRTVSIFTDRANHRAVRAELALATGYYMRDGSEYCLEPVELPDLNRRMPLPDQRLWDRTRVREFPFIAACLLQGVGFDAQQGLTHVAYPEPLGTVYRDTSPVWGMVVVDITNLDAVGYGIVGFSSCEMLIDTPQTRSSIRSMAALGRFTRGTHRVIEEVRPRSAMSATEYMTKLKCNRDGTSASKMPAGMPLMGTDDFTLHSDIASKLLAGTPLIDVAAMGIVWPPEGLEDDIIPSLAYLSVGANDISLPDQAVRALIQSTLDGDDFDISIFDEVRNIPNFQDLLWRNLLQHSAQPGSWSTRSAGQLIRLAFADQEHLGLEQLNGLSAEAVAGALSVLEPRKVTSISLCIDSIRSTAAQLIDVLSQVDTLREIYFLQSPSRESDALSVQLFEELAARPQIMLRAKVMLAGAYSAALRQRFWLPTTPKSISSNVANVSKAVQVAPLDVFPVQQMLVRRQTTSRGNIQFEHQYVHLGDALLKPERFATGFLLYLHSLVPFVEWLNPKAQLFCFSSAPASFAVDELTSAEISPILAENFAMGAERWPRVRDLVPGGWTVIVSLEIHRNCKVTKFHNDCRHPDSHFIRYAFVRACGQRIVVDLPSRTPPGPEELEVVGLKEFLKATAPEVDLAVVDRRLHDVAKALNSRWYQAALPPSIEPVSVLSHVDAVEILLDCLKDAMKM